MKYVYIINRFQAKEKTADIIRKLKSVSERFCRDFEIKVNDTPRDAELMKDYFKDTAHVVTAVGGDGSIYHLINDLVGTQNILSFIPYGTGNDFYRTVSITLTSGIHKADLIRINDRYAINIASFGFEADAANDERFTHNRLIPKPLRLSVCLLWHLLTFKRGRLLRIEIGDEIIEGEFTTVAALNGQFFGGGCRLSPYSHIDDGIMEVYAVDKLSKAGVIKLVMSTKNAEHLKNSAVRAFQSNKAVISSPYPFSASIDGEPYYSDRFELELIREGIRLEYDERFLSYFRE